jgi:hypothetical protein
MRMLSQAVGEALAEDSNAFDYPEPNLGDVCTFGDYADLARRMGVTSLDIVMLTDTHSYTSDTILGR